MSDDLDSFLAMLDAAMPWLEASTILIALVIGISVLLAAIDFVRRRRSPVERLVRQREGRRLW